MTHYEIVIEVIDGYEVPRKLVDQKSVLLKQEKWKDISLTQFQISIEKCVQSLLKYETKDTRVSSRHDSKVARLIWVRKNILEVTMTRVRRNNQRLNWKNSICKT